MCGTTWARERDIIQIILWNVDPIYLLCNKQMNIIAEMKAGKMRFLLKCLFSSRDVIIFNFIKCITLTILIRTYIFYFSANIQLQAHKLKFNEIQPTRSYYSYFSNFCQLSSFCLFCLIIGTITINLFIQQKKSLTYLTRT